jgi:CheY-like chemotaxis protein/uncharacterized coiled-coil protein SlyX
MPELISSIAQLLWPLIALAALFVFRRAIGRILRTAEKRELEFEVGGQRLTMHELNDQQNEMIQDLQLQLSMLSKQLEGGKAAAPAPGSASLVPPPDHDEEPSPDGAPAADLPPKAAELPPVHAPVGPEPFAVLWVSERPESHALLVEQLRDNGVRVTMASTTSEALAEISERPYRLIVSDMSRKEEDGRYRADAGLSLLRELRDLGVDVPVIMYSGQRGQLQYGAQARQSGAVATTSSAYEMFKHFQNFGLL